MYNSRVCCVLYLLPLGVYRFVNTCIFSVYIYYLFIWKYFMYRYIFIYMYIHIYIYIYDHLYKASFIEYIKLTLSLIYFFLFSIKTAFNWHFCTHEITITYVPGYDSYLTIHEVSSRKFTRYFHE